MTMVKQLVLVCAVLGACGGGKKPAEQPTEREAPVEQQDQSGDMIPPESIEQIQNQLARKQNIVSRCLADAVDAKELPKNSRGKVTLDIVISPSGTPDKVEVISSTLDSEKLKTCVVGHVKSIIFPQLPKPFPTSYTYAFEAM